MSVPLFKTVEHVASSGSETSCDLKCWRSPDGFISWELRRALVIVLESRRELDIGGLLAESLNPWLAYVSLEASAWCASERKGIEVWLIHGESCEGT
eukprot:726780-Amphidinium_carterae.3